MKVILSVPAEGYFERTLWRLFTYIYIYISYKPFQCWNTDYWAGDTLEELIVHHQRYRPSDSNKNVSNSTCTTRWKFISSFSWIIIFFQLMLVIISFLYLFNFADHGYFVFKRFPHLIESNSSQYYYISYSY
jgi:hypothetical protein